MVFDRLCTFLVVIKEMMLSSKAEKLIRPADSKMEKNDKSILAGPFLLVALIIGMWVLSRFVDVSVWLESLRSFAGDSGLAGILLYIVVYIFASLVAFPVSLLNVVAGAAYGTFHGTVILSFGTTLGAAAAFLMARGVARRAVYRMLSGRRMFKRIDRMTENRGGQVVAMARLASIIPFAVLNYGFGVTRVSFGPYLFWSWLCSLPGIFLYAASSDAAVQTMEGRSTPWGLILSACAVALALIAAMIRFRRRLLHGRKRQK